MVLLRRLVDVPLAGPGVRRLGDAGQSRGVRPAAVDTHGAGDVAAAIDSLRHLRDRPGFRANPWS